MAARDTPVTGKELEQAKKKGNSSATGPLAIQTQEKMAEALELRKQGLSYLKIGQAMGISEMYAHTLVRKAMKQIIKEPAKDVIALELQRLDTLWQNQFSKVLKAQENETSVGKDTIESCIKIMDRRAKLLGLDRPTKIAATDEEGNVLKAVPTFTINMVPATEKPVIIEADGHDIGLNETITQLRSDSVPDARADDVESEERQPDGESPPL